MAHLCAISSACCSAGSAFINHSLRSLFNETIMLLVSAGRADQRAGIAVFRESAGPENRPRRSCDRDRFDRSIPLRLETLAMIERRATKRIPINRAARLSFGKIGGTHPCMVRDISALGACISTPYYIFASEFELSFDGRSGIFICRVVWRKETLCGVCFVLRRRSPKSANDSSNTANVVRLGHQIRCGRRRG